MDWQKIVQEIEIKEEMQEELLCRCRKQKHVPNILFRYSKAAAVAAGLLLCSVASLTVYAAVNAYQARLEAMDDGEVTDYYDLAQVGDGEADSWSRELSKSEDSRLRELRTEMERGERFPEGEIPLEGRDGDFYYDAQKRIFHLPEEELTEEQLLQILDLWAKEDYSLQKRNQELGITAVEPEETFSTNLVDYMQESPEYVRAREVVEEIYGIDTKDMETEVRLWENRYQEGENLYLIRFRDAGRAKTYDVQLKACGGELCRVPKWVHCFGTGQNKNSDGEEWENPTEEKMRNIYEKGKEIATDILEIEEPISSGYCFYNEEYPNTLRVALELESGDRYLLSFRSDTEKLGEVMAYEKERYGSVEFLLEGDVVLDME